MSITRKALENLASPYHRSLSRESELATLCLELGKALAECVSDMPDGCADGPSCHDCIEHENACTVGYAVESARTLLARLEWGEP